MVAGLAVGGVAMQGELDRSSKAEAAVADGAVGSRVTTPVLSARRTPDLLVAPQALRRLTNAVGPTLARLPQTTCFELRDANRHVVGQAVNDAFAPASNQKILTGWTALEVFGTDHTFTTTFAAPGGISGGVVNGDLWVIGGGDPLIDSDIYQSSQRWGKGQHTSIEAIGDQLVALGLTQVTGSIIADDSYFDDVRTVTTWPARFISQGQVGPLSALAVNDARSYGVVAGQGSSAVPRSDAAVWAAESFTAVLGARGVSIAGTPTAGIAPSGLTTVHTVASLPMSQIVSQMLTFSDNNTAELLIKAIGKERSGTGSTEAGLAVMAEQLGTLGIDLSQLVLRDGSGLDEGNRVTCSILQEVLNDAGPDGPLAEGLPDGNGAVGTLKDRFRNSPGSGRVHAKTGTLRSVSALSGWVQSDSGRWLSFSTIVNTGDRQVTGDDLALEDRLAEQILSYPDAIDPASVSPTPAG